ncbi:unnamed protein product [Owenia fusiformis]|uniref:Decapping nuclease n=1 Tax=Owenia fusiformis TaxID=6347 RepID=A0A8S4PEW7_OWEFU|nr:unnamed protein product [Owenia fusiformis]
MHNFNKFEICDKETTSLNTDFVCWRGLLTKILTTPFESKDDWWIGVSLFNGTYYLREVETPRKKSEKENMSRRHEEMSYWGYKFEQYMTTDTVDGIADTRRPVDCNEAYCTVVRGRLRGHSLVYSGETDCCIKHPDGRQEYVELKTSREIYKPNQERNFKRFKLLKWWLQSFLPGVPKIIAGFRDDDGIVHRIQTYKTEDIPKLVKGERDMWDAATCFNFCDAFLSHIKRVVTIDDPRRVVLFKWAPRYDITCMWEDTEQYRFLPDWYIDWMNKKMKQSM